MSKESHRKKRRRKIRRKQERLAVCPPEQKSSGRALCMTAVSGPAAGR